MRFSIVVSLFRLDGCGVKYVPSACFFGKIPMRVIFFGEILLSDG